MRAIEDQIREWLTKDNVSVNEEQFQKIVGLTMMYKQHKKLEVAYSTALLYWLALDGEEDRDEYND